MHPLDTPLSPIAPNLDLSYCLEGANQSTTTQSFEELLRQIDIAENERLQMMAVVKEMRGLAHAHLHALYSPHIRHLNEENEQLREQLVTSKRACETDRSMQSKHSLHKLDKENRFSQTIRAISPHKTHRNKSLSRGGSLSRDLLHSDRSFCSEPAFDKSLFTKIIAEVYANQQRKAEAFAMAVQEQVELEQRELKEYKEAGRSLSSVEQLIVAKEHNLQQLVLVLREYQEAIERTNRSLEEVKAATDRLCRAKGTYIEMELKCTRQPQLEKRLLVRRQDYCHYQLAKNHGKQEIHSLQLLFKAFGVQIAQDGDNKAQQYLIGLKNIDRGEALSKTKGEGGKTIVREIKGIMEGLKEERRKHKELVEVYLRRIDKMASRLKKFERE